ncbi:MAG: hypothetical protein R3F49_23200, partial [Planctomycetota bacterium]
PWRALVRDASPAVRRALYVSIQDHLNRSGQSPFTVAELEALFGQLSTAPDAALSAEFAPDLSRAVSWLDRAKGSTSERARAALSLLRSPWPPVREAAFTTLRRSKSLRDALGEVLQSYQARPDDPEDLMRYLDGLVTTLASADDETQDAKYVRLIVGGPPQVEWAKTIVAGPPGRLGNKAPEVSLMTDLGPDSALRALRAMIEADPERVWQALLNTDWAPAADALRAALQGDDPDPRTRVVLNAALITAEPANVAPRAAVRAALEELAGGDLGTLQQSIGWASTAASKAPSAALSLLGELLASPRLSDEALDVLSAPKPPQEGYPRELARSVVDALERRVVAAGADAASRFAPMQYYLLKAMIQDPALYRPKLARNWLKDNPRWDDLALAAKLAGDTELVDILGDQVLDSLARYTGSSEWEIKALIERALAVAGEESAARLATIAATTRSHGLREELVKRLETIALSRELAARLARTSTPEDDRARAIEETLTLLDDPTEDVRVQAIRGLAILGATAEVPRLVGLVGSGSAAEKKAALEALDLLYRRAAQADQ